MLLLRALVSALLAGVPLGAIPPALSPKAQALVKEAFTDLDPNRPLIDIHAHLVGNGKGASGCEVNPELFGARRPFRRMVARNYLKATGAPDDATFDEVYVARCWRWPRNSRFP